MSVRLLALVTLALLGPAASAHASTLSMGSTTPMLFFHADPAERNRVVVRLVPDGVEIRDSGSAIAAGAGCEALGAHRVLCASNSSPPRLRANLGDRNDTMRIVDGEPATTAIGGPGDDEIAGSDDPDLLFGGPGRDVLRGRWGHDQLSGGGGNDVIEGGGDGDTVSYASHRRRVSVDLARGEGKGPGAGLDRISGVEHLTGGAGDDRLAGDARDNRFDGGPGRNRLIGRGGDDAFARGSGGISCGEGRDSVRAWSLDPIQDLAASCEWVETFGTQLPAQPEAVRPRWVRWSVSCPSERRCSPTIRLSEPGGRQRPLAEITLPAEPWTDRPVRLRLNRVGRRRLRTTPAPRVTVEVSIPEWGSSHWRVRLNRRA